MLRENLEIEKKESFGGAYDKMTPEQQKYFKGKYLTKYSITLFYSDKNGISNVPENRMAFVREIAADLKIKKIWDK